MSSQDSRPAFDLHALVRSVTDGSSLRGPREIAAKVAENVPANKRLAALEDALVPYVRIYLQHARQPASPAPKQTGNRNSARSSKVTAIREGWKKTLAGQFHIGAGEWQALADCTYENVAFLAAERRDVAARTVAAAEMFEALANAMRKAKVNHVRDLPESVLAQILTAEDVAA